MAQLQEPGGFPVDPAAPDRQQCWDMLGENVRSRLAAKAGRVLQWWARLEGDTRPKVIVFGELGLCTATPLVEDGTRVYRIDRLPLEPGSLRHRRFEAPRAAERGDGPAERGGGSAVARVFGRRGRNTTPPAATTTPTTPIPAPGTGLVPTPLNLPDEAQGILGNFPPEVQRYLQNPFLANDHRVVADWYYHEQLDVAHSRILFLYALSADRNITVAAATRTLARGRPQSYATWQAEAYHGRVRTT
ncbi:hypothetical protein AB0B50_32845 [Streptomyces sp. NPDC041068]|uniref:hypothetical protein n=1 Tax=Streptomyces sp. NPDC041068 TaxID=3155130 RepID=UPI0033F841BD